MPRLKRVSLAARYVDAAGRRQYRYHDHWRVTRDLAKHERVCRASYIDPRLIDLNDGGVVVRTDLRVLGDDVQPGEPATHGCRRGRRAPVAQRAGTRRRPRWVTPKVGV